MLPGVGAVNDRLTDGKTNRFMVGDMIAEFIIFALSYSRSSLKAISNFRVSFLWRLTFSSVISTNNPDTLRSKNQSLSGEEKAFDAVQVTDIDLDVTFILYYL